VRLSFFHILTTGNTSNLFSWFVYFKMYFMHFRVYFVAYSVHSPPMGRYISVKKFATGSYLSTKSRLDVKLKINK